MKQTSGALVSYKVDQSFSLLYCVMVSMENQETPSHLLSKKVARRQIKQNINIKLSPDSLQTSMACLKTNNKRCLENVKRHLEVRYSTDCATFSQLINK